MVYAGNVFSPNSNGSKGREMEINYPLKKPYMSFSANGLVFPLIIIYESTR